MLLFVPSGFIIEKSNAVLQLAVQLLSLQYRSISNILQPAHIQQ